MAGGKETPRQKMVGMMYLVLTALLALQVTSAILDKFIFIDESLKHSVDVSRAASDKVLKGMGELVAKEGNRPKDVEVLKQAEAVKDETNKLLASMNDMREGLIKATGGREENGSLKGAKDQDMVMNFMLGPEGAKNGKAYELKKMLDAYTAKMAAMDTALKGVIKPIALDGKDMSMYQANNEYNKTQRGKDFAEVNFAETPLVASLAVMRQMESEVARVESKVLEVLSQKVGVVAIKFDQIVARVTAESKVVAAGTKYKAKMFIAASSSKITPKMSSSAGSVKVENGEGTIEFTAQGGGYDANGNAKKQWKGTITIPTAYGDTTFTVTEEYIVAKPVIQVQSANVSALYLNCGNELSIQVPALGASYDPSFGATGAEVIKSGSKGVITVVPSAASVTLRVSSGGNLIGEEKFKVRLLPKPDIEIRSGARKIDEKLGGAMPRALKAVAVADPSIKDAIPKDARYRVTDWEVTLARGKRAIGNIKVNSEDANLTNLAANAKEGDRLVIEVKGVKRLNFKNQTEDVRVGSVIIQYPITQ